MVDEGWKRDKFISFIGASQQIIPKIEEPGNGNIVKLLKDRDVNTKNAVELKMDDSGNRKWERFQERISGFPNKP